MSTLIKFNPQKLACHSLLRKAAVAEEEEEGGGIAGGGERVWKGQGGRLTVAAQSPVSCPYFPTDIA